MRRWITMTHVIKFDAYTSYQFNEKDDLMNYYYLKHECDFMMKMYELRGYIYLNRIYENLGIKWDPSNENILFRYSGNDKIKFEIEKMVSAPGYMVIIDIHD